ncbi:MAG: hypothetical protein NVSMB57_14940 [Actinomycetota bacterium]
MVRIRFLIPVALVCLALASPATALPFLGQTQMNLTWSPGIPAIGENVTFAASASDNDGNVRVATLCFGDGSPCSNEILYPSPIDTALSCVRGSEWNRQWQHRFPRSGTFRMSFTVSTRGCFGLHDKTASVAYDITVR